MLIIPVKEGEAIERALKRFKRKFDKTGVMKQLRARQQFNKPSVIKRKEHAKAVYVQSLREKENEQFIDEVELVKKAPPERRGFFMDEMSYA